MHNICIIPARGGSKRIPKKNIREFFGKPIISYVIDVAIKSKLFDQVMVSTDDTEIERIALEYGAVVPFKRSEKNADDNAVLADVVLEVLSAYKEEGSVFDNVCCILPTAPFISTQQLLTSYHKLEKDNFDSVFPVVEFASPIQRSLKIEGQNVEMVWKEHLNSRSQDLDKRYHDAGQFYWLQTDAFLKEKKLFMKNSAGVIIEALHAQDIDSEIDWKLAELKYKLMMDEKDNSL